eukprot:c15449_g1_i2.p1 GENE.c15449_g1_i2~~c15449_g1_i2.p1  ORF type:complete len:192 (-),score=29.38 c15449_g1_i2:166-708(-)
MTTNELSTGLYNAVMDENLYQIRSIVTVAQPLASKDLGIGTFGYTALHWAARYGSSRVVQLLCELGCEVNARDRFGRTPVFVAAWDGHYNAIQILHTHCADINIPDVGRFSPLMIAVHSNHVKVVQVLMSLGANLCAKSEDGVSAHDLAIKLKHFDIAAIIHQVAPSTPFFRFRALNFPL